jgi:hypothetical protein
LVWLADEVDLLACFRLHNKQPIEEMLVLIPD